MDGRLLLLLLLVSVCSPVLGDGYHCSDEKVDVKCPECQPIRPMKDFDEEKFLGVWYETRWYLPKPYTVSDELFDPVFVYFKKPGEKRNLYYTIDCSQKDSPYCDPTMNEMMTEIRPGQYWTSDGPWVDNFTTTILYTDYDNFAVQYICFEDLEGNCENVELTFWSRTTEMRRCDVEKGEKIAKDICHFDLNRFIDMKHKTDCLPFDPAKCKEKDYKKKNDNNEQM